jgi:hypothetical protein
MVEWRPEVREVLERAGWWPGRKIDTDRWRSQFESTGIPMHQAADAFLQEFGNLSVSISGPGISRAREPFVIDPELLWDSEEDRFLEWSETIGRRLFPLGELDHGRHFLGIDEHSEVYLVETWVASFGPMPSALENLILGVASHVIDDGS